MQKVSEAFRAAMKSRAYLAKITVDNGDIVHSDAIKSMGFSAGCNEATDKITVGSAVASSVQIVLDSALFSAALDERVIQVWLGFRLSGQEEWLLMGTYHVSEIRRDDGAVTVVAMDSLAKLFDVPYKSIQGMDFSSGVSSTALLEALCARRGVAVDVHGLPALTLDSAPPEGYTERQIIGLIASLYGRFAVIDRAGALQLRWYAKTDAVISAKDYYDGAMERAEHDFIVGWLTCYNEFTGKTLPAGDLHASQGIDFTCPWMTEHQLGAVWEAMQGFGYRPVKGVSFFGNPCIDPGDVIVLAAMDGSELAVPVMSVRHEYDGGISTTISAAGQIRTDGYKGPMQQSIERKAKRAASEEIFNLLTGNGENQGVFMQGDQLYINASYILAGVLRGIEIIGENGSIAGFRMTENTLSAKWRKDFPEFTQEDLQIIADVYMNWSTYTAEEQAAYLERYDVNMDGRINASDAVVISGMIEGRHPNYTEGQITIDASSPKACIVLEVTGGFRAGQKLVLGLGFVRASSVEADSFSCSGSQGYTGEVTVGGSVLTIKGGIITAVT